MDKDRLKGAANDMKGKAKEAVGKVTGDTKTEAEGRVKSKTLLAVQRTLSRSRDRRATRHPGRPAGTPPAFYQLPAAYPRRDSPT